jgi:HK97 family phage portal protein
MITEALIKALDRADSPRAVGVTTWALELATGFKTEEVVSWYQSKSSVPFNPRTYRGEDYDPARDGFYRLGALYNGGGRSHSGRTVSFDSALESSAVFSCVKIIAEDIARLPFFLYEKSRTGRLEKAYGHRLYRLLHDAPNPEMSSSSFREALTARALMGLDGYARIQRGSDGRIIALWPLTDEGTSVTMDRVKETRRLIFKVKEGNSPENEYSARDMFHLKGFTLDGQRGDEILRRARHTFGLTLSADEYAGQFFANDATPGVVLSRPAGTQALGPDGIREVKKAWITMHGRRNRHEPAIVQEGMTVSRIDPDHQKLQLIESRKHQIAEVARVFRMPLHKIAELDRSTNNNIEHQGIEYTGHTLGPWCGRWEESVHLQLLDEDEKYYSDGRPRMYAEFNVEAMQKGDFAAQAKFFTSMIQYGVFNVDEVRAWFNKNKVKGGDIHRMQMQMQDISMPPATAVTADGVDSDNQRFQTRN